jgi:hypothetical protein
LKNIEVKHLSGRTRPPADQISPNESKDMFLICCTCVDEKGQVPKDALSHLHLVCSAKMAIKSGRCGTGVTLLQLLNHKIARISGWTVALWPGGLAPPQRGHFHSSRAEWPLR